MSTALAESKSGAFVPADVARRGLSEAQWRTLTGSLYPGARPESVLMVVDYCAARKLDPLKKPCHIVPMRVGEAWRDVIMPGIYELRTTAQRTGQYLGHSVPDYGPVEEQAGVAAPAWCAMTIYRLHPTAGRIEFPVRTYFRECVQTKKDGRANDRWSRAPIQMLTKVCEAAGLREAFPDELGGEMTAEEMDGAPPIVEPTPPVRPAQRKSEQAATAPPVPPPVIDAEVAADVPASIGRVTSIREREGKALVMLETGFKAATNDAEIIASLKTAHDAGMRLELVTKPSSDPVKYAPIITEIIPDELGVF